MQKEQIPAGESTLPEQDQESEEQEFRIESDKQADWALEKIKELQEEQQENHELAEERIEPLQKKIDKIRAWEERENEKIQDSIDYFESLLEDYARRLKQENEDLKTHSLPFGKLKFRKQRPKYNYNDDELLEFLEENEIDAVRVKKKPNKRKLKKLAEVKGDKLVLESGLIVDGVQIQERGEKFKLEVE
jgi:antitoxin component HigA of HigAB toxin-antitoxin module